MKRIIGGFANATQIDDHSPMYSPLTGLIAALGLSLAACSSDPVAPVAALRTSGSRLRVVSWDGGDDAKLVSGMCVAQ
jgi:hypothetical protein